MNRRNIVVIGASAGGVEAVRSLTAQLPSNLPATLLVVIHMPPNHRSYLAQAIGRGSALKVEPGENFAELKQGVVYVAVPDHHLLIQDGHLRLIRGPKENRHRPAADPLFRSAAYWYGPRVIGVVLSGSLDDGTAGLKAIKERGGIAIVQDPEEALYPGMPSSALQNVSIDYTLPIAEIASLLDKLVREQALPEPEFPVSKLLEMEYKVQEEAAGSADKNEQIGHPSMFSCPECGGVLYELDSAGDLRFRCRVGHAFSPENMMEEQAEAFEKALYTALKTLEESSSLSQRIVNEAKQAGHQWLADRFGQKLNESRERAEFLRSVLTYEGNRRNAGPAAAIEKRPKSKKRRRLARSEK